MSALPTFRIHFADGTTLDVDAVNAKDARAAAEKQHSAQIRKIKLVRGPK